MKNSEKLLKREKIPPFTMSINGKNIGVVTDATIVTEEKSESVIETLTGTITFTGTMSDVYIDPNFISLKDLSEKNDRTKFAKFKCYIRRKAHDLYQKAKRGIARLLE